MSYWFAAGRRAGIVVINARRTSFTDCAFLNTFATSGSSKTANAPGFAALANRLGLDLA